MKVEESPLDVLSRAASIVQSEEKPSLETSQTILCSHDVEETATARRSPKRSISTCNDTTSKRVKMENYNNESGKIENYNRSLPPPYIYHVLQTSKQNAIIPPPLITTADKGKYLAMPPPYSTFFPRPSVISTTTTSPGSKFTEHYAKSKNCSCCKVEYCTVSYNDVMRKDKNGISKDFELPTVDDHFRKSLGAKYDLPHKPEQINERPSSVDEHFEKALGKKWYNLGKSS